MEFKDRKATNPGRVIFRGRANEISHYLRYHPCG